MITCTVEVGRDGFGFQQLTVAVWIPVIAKPATPAVWTRGFWVIGGVLLRRRCVPFVGGSDAREGFGWGALRTSEALVKRFGHQVAAAELSRASAHPQARPGNQRVVEGGAW